MSEQQPAQPRPPQVTVACLIVMLGSVFVVLLMWDRISDLHTMATRQSVQDFLSRSDLRRAGLDLAGLLTTVKVVSMVTAALAVATAVQGWHATRRSRSARVWLTVLTVPLFLSALVGDGFVGSADATFWCSGVGAAVLTLWLGPNRLWFGDAGPATRPPATVPRLTLPPTLPPSQRPDQAHQPPVQAPPQAPTGQPGQPGPSAFPFGTPPPSTSTSRLASPPAPAWAPPPTSAYDVRRARAARPRALLWACVITWVCTAVAGSGLALSIAMMSHDSDSVLHELYQRDPQLSQEGLSQHAVLVMLYAISGLVLVAAVAAAVFALLLFLRRPWAWYALVVSACGATLLFLIGSFGSPVAIVLLVASVATVACLVRPEVRAWLLRR